MRRSLCKPLVAAALSLSFFLPVPVFASVQKDGVHITILHTNDIHARVKDGDERENSMGMGWIAGAIRAQKDRDADTLALDAGDTFHGLPIINISKGAGMAQLMNLAGYDAMTPGNHDFNYGAERLHELAGMLNFPMLSANLVDREGKGYVFRPYQSYVLDGVKVAVIGLTTPEVAYKTNPANVQAVKILDPVATAQKWVPELRKTHDVVIGLMHMGVDESSEVTSERIAKEVPGFDVIIDGHSHTQLDKGLMVGQTLICQTGAHGHYLGEVELVVKDHQLRKAQAELLDKSAVQKLAGQQDAGVQAALKGIEVSNKAEFQKVVATSPRVLSCERGLVRAHEAELGDLTADAIRWGAQADIGIVNGGGIRANLPKGKVTKANLMEMFPFGNTLKKLEVSGSLLHEVLEHSVEFLPYPFGGFLQVSGVTFTVDPTAKAGSRVTDIKVGNAPLVTDKKYTLAVNDFTAVGGDNYTMLKSAKVVGEYGTLEEIFADYLNQHGTQPASTGRITIKK